jgi:hypothetical protein
MQVALLRGFWTSAFAEGGDASFGLLVDCHFEVDEEVTVTDIDSGAGMGLPPPCQLSRSESPSLRQTLNYRSVVSACACCGTGKIISVETGQRDHVWTFMTDVRDAARTRIGYPDTERIGRWPCISVLAHACTSHRHFSFNRGDTATATHLIYNANTDRE